MRVAKPDLQTAAALMVKSGDRHPWTLQRVKQPAEPTMPRHVATCETDLCDAVERDEYNIIYLYTDRGSAGPVQNGGAVLLQGDVGRHV